MEFLLTPLREGRLYLPFPCRRCFAAFLLTPLREGRQIIRKYFGLPEQFLLTPLREGRLDGLCDLAYVPSISTHAPAGGATSASSRSVMRRGFLLTPLREGRQTHTPHTATSGNFYSRPCGRGDGNGGMTCMYESISTHAPAGGATQGFIDGATGMLPFLLTPLREGRHGKTSDTKSVSITISTHAPAGGATELLRPAYRAYRISTHAPAGGATKWP